MEDASLKETVHATHVVTVNGLRFVEVLMLCQSTKQVSAQNTIFHTLNIVDVFIKQNTGSKMCFYCVFTIIR